MRKIKGFSFTEAIVAVVIIAVLGSIVMPAYKNYTIRSRVSEALTMATPSRMLFVEYVVGKSLGQVPSCGSTPEITPFPNLTDPSRYVSAVTWKDNCVLEVRVNSITSQVAEDNSTYLSLILEPSIQNGSITWRCKHYDSTNGIGRYIRYVPENCLTKYSH